MTSDPMPCEQCGRPHPRCTAHTRGGKPCGQPRMDGQTVCRMHGGSSPQARAAAEQRQLVAAADRVVSDLWVGLDQATPVKDPVASMERLAGALEQLVDEAGRRVSLLKNIAGGEHLTQLRAEVTLLDRALGRLSELLDRMARLGIAERHVTLEESRAEVIVVAFTGAIDLLGSLLPEGLLPADRDQVVRRYLELLGDVVPGEVVP